MRQCANFDNCCPPGCDYVNDNDCPAYSRTQWATAPNNFSAMVGDLFLRRCLRETNLNEEQWLALKLTVRFDGQGSMNFSPDSVVLYDDFLKANFTPASPNGTDCFDRDFEYLLAEGPVNATERTGLVYFNYKDLPLAITSKRIAVDAGNSTRLVWLLQPSG
jgi:hypothetical protein